MNTKITVLSLLALQSVSLFAMDFEIIELKPIYIGVETEEKWDSSFLSTDNLNIQVPDLYVGGKATTRENDNGKKESGELVYLDEKDPIKKVSFRQLIAEQHKKDMAYILAVLLVKNKQGKYVRYYQDAASITERMFDKKMYRTSTYEIMKRKIEKPIYFYSIFPGNKDFKYLTSESSLNSNLIKFSPNLLDEAVYFFLVNIGRRKDGRAFNYAGIFCDRKDEKELKLKYYLKAIDLKSTDAMYNYAAICLADKKYKEAEQYALMTLENGDRDIDCFVKLAQIYFAQKKYDLVKENIEKGRKEGRRANVVHKALMDMIIELLDEKLSNTSE